MKIKKVWAYVPVKFIKRTFFGDRWQWNYAECILLGSRQVSDGDGNYIEYLIKIPSGEVRSTSCIYSPN